MQKIGFIGIGNMGGAIYERLVKSKKLSQLDMIFTDIDVEKCHKMQKKTHTIYSSCISELVINSDYVVIAVKPQVLDKVLDEIKPHLRRSTVVISIVAGVPSEKIKVALGSAKVVRAMPNTPAMVGEGMTGISYDEHVFTEEQIAFIDMFFSTFGKYIKVPENLMNVVTCACGSSPAYVYMFIEALADSVVKYGMSRDDAYTFVAQTVLGAAKMVVESGEHPAVLKDRVCSPGGTTIAAVAALEENGFRNSIIKATDACYEIGEIISNRSK